MTMTPKPEAALGREKASMSKAPRRAHELICKIGADTKEDLIFAIEGFARDIARNELSNGCSGSPSVGTVYSYTHAPEMTHDRYFQELNTYLEMERARASKEKDDE